MKNICENNIHGIENEYLGKCYPTLHALERFKEYLCKTNKKLITKSADYFNKEFCTAFYNSKQGKIKNYHNVIRLMNNDYKESHYLFNHNYNIRFVVVNKNKYIVTCEPIKILNLKEKLHESNIY